MCINLHRIIELCDALGAQVPLTRFLFYVAFRVISVNLNTRSYGRH